MRLSDEIRAGRQRVQETLDFHYSFESRLERRREADILNNDGQTDFSDAVQIQKQKNIYNSHRFIHSSHRRILSDLINKLIIES